MKKLIKTANIAFYLLMFVIFFFISVYIAGFVGAGENQMLAGGAIVSCFVHHNDAPNSSL